MLLNNKIFIVFFLSFFVIGCFNSPKNLDKNTKTSSGVGADCQSYFDGCNICNRSTREGSLSLCTKKFCEIYEEPLCLDDKKILPIPSKVNNNSLYKGLKLEEARSLAIKRNTPFRVVQRDGQALIVTMDHVVGRINAIVTDDVVTDYFIEGVNRKRY